VPDNCSTYIARMNLIKTLYVILAVVLSVVIMGISCVQFSVTDQSMEILLEGPLDEDAKDTSDDFADDKEYISHVSIPSNYLSDVLHSEGYLVSHANRVKEIFTPPPKS
jgi:hypothetical protein